MSEPIRVLIADDHPIVRQGLRLVFSVQPDLALVAEATNGLEAVQMTHETQPDVIVMDLVLPMKDGLTAIREISEEFPSARILVLTSFDDDEMVFKAIKGGALGFLLKDSAPEQLLDAIRSVYRGESALQPTIARKVLQEFKRPTAQPKAEELLTSRELEVLQRLAQGLTNRDIAGELNVSIRTVTTHVRHILDKLHLANRTQAALYARALGLKSPGQ
jgi:two-component system, NarL family, response regulator LiaR